MKELSTDTERALEQIANGWTRTATAAHPDCLCGGRAQYTRVKCVDYGHGPSYVPLGWEITIPCPVHKRQR